MKLLTKNEDTCTHAGVCTPDGTLISYFRRWSKIHYQFLFPMSTENVGSSKEQIQKALKNTQKNHDKVVTKACGVLPMSLITDFETINLPKGVVMVAMKAVNVDEIRKHVDRSETEKKLAEGVFEGPDGNEYHFTPEDEVLYVVVRKDGVDRTCELHYADDHKNKVSNIIVCPHDVDNWDFNLDAYISQVFNASMTVANHLNDGTCIDISGIASESSTPNNVTPLH